MKPSHTQISHPTKPFSPLQLPKFNSRPSFFGNHKQSKRKDISQQISQSRLKDRQSFNAPIRFNRHRYRDASPTDQVPDQIRKLRNSENLCLRRGKNKSTKERYDEKEMEKAPSPKFRRFFSLSTKSVKRKPEIKPLQSSFRIKDSSQIKQPKNASFTSSNFKPLKVQNERVTAYSSSKKVRDARLRRERRSEVINVKKSASRSSNERPMTPKYSEPFEEEKTNEIEVDILDPSYLMLVENVLANICEGIRVDSAEIYELSLCYITLEKEQNEKCMCRLFKDQGLIAMIRQYLTLQRISVYIVVHLYKNKLKKKQKLSELWELVVNTFKTHSIVTDLILEILVQTNQIKKKDFKIKQIGKEKKIKQIIKLISLIKKRVIEILNSKEDNIFELIFSLFLNSMKIQSLEYISVIDKTLKWQILKLPTYPYLPPPLKQYSLVLDLDQTLIHFNTKSMELMIRPYAEEFIIKMSKLFQIIIFTAGTKQYADDLIDEIDPTHCVSFRLYRNHINIHEGIPIKNLSMLGRDLKTTIIVDNLIQNFRFQPENGIRISTWEGDIEDIALSKLEYVLRNIMKLYSHNFPEGIKRWSNYIKEHIAFSPLIYELKKDI